jgi:Mg-chelatase subunit ChlD/DNA-directed RNA polymerase subunit RPC12/RpoP
LDPNSKRKYQLGIGFAIFAFAVSVSYFSVVEADVQDTPQYDIYLVIDVSGSMGTCGQPLNPDMTCEQIIITDDSPIVFAKQAAIEFVDVFQLDQSSDHRIGLISFSNYAQMLVKLDNNSKNLKEGINKLYPKGATAMGDGILIATQSLSEEARPDAQKIIVLLSDGMSNMGEHPLLAAGIARENDVTIFSVGYGYDPDVQTLKAIASGTHGKYYNALTGQDLANAFNEIADVLISPLSHYSSRILILIAIPVLLFIPTIERGLTIMMKRAEDKPVAKIVKPKKIEEKPKVKDKLKITCPNCNHVNRTTSKFCVKCGNSIKVKDKLKITCPNCNHVNRTTSKFCVKCGNSIKGKVK